MCVEVWVPRVEHEDIIGRREGERLKLEWAATLLLEDEAIYEVALSCCLYGVRICMYKYVLYGVYITFLGCSLRSETGVEAENLGLT